MTIKIYKNDSANAVFIEDPNGVQFMNSLKAINTTSGISIVDLSKKIEIASNIPYERFVDENDNLYGNDVVSVVNELNSIFSSSGSPDNELPQITSSLNINMAEGDTINYELLSSYGVGYEWDLSNVPGVVTVDGNIRKLIGGNTLDVGVYSIPVKAINYSGTAEEVITLTVNNPPFFNTKSIRFNNNDYLEANATSLSNIFNRSNGTGSPWTISLWFKRGTSESRKQTIFSYSGQEINNSGYISIVYNGRNSDKNITLTYGSENNKITLETPNNSITQDWHHILISYDGGTTGAVPNDIDDYYGRFKILIDNVLMSTSNNNVNDGYSGDMIGEFIRIGTLNYNDYLRNNCNVDEVAIWNSEQSNNSSAIYNNGVPPNLNELANKPSNWWNMESASTYPVVRDWASDVDLVMNNMTLSDIVNDVPQ